MTGVLFVAFGLWCLVRGAGIAARAAAGARPSATRSAGRRARRSDRHGRRPLPVHLGHSCTRRSASTPATGSRSRRPSSTGWASTRSRASRAPGTTTSRSCSYYDTAILLAALFAFPWQEWRRDPLLRAVLLLAPITLAAGVYGALRPESPMLPAWGAAAGGARGRAWSRSSSGRTAEPARDARSSCASSRSGPSASLAIYGWAREKVPWLTVHPLLPLTILAAIGVARPLARAPPRRGRPRRPRRRSACCSPSTPAGCTSPCFRYGAHDVEKEPGPRRDARLRPDDRRISSARSAPSRRREGARRRRASPSITVAGEATWPLTWYLRDVNDARGPRGSTRPRRRSSSPTGTRRARSRSSSRAKYDAKRVPIRAWWFPEPTKEGGVVAPDASGTLLRWWLFHEIWSPIGSQDATFFVRKDLARHGHARASAARRSRTRPSRDYPSDATELPPPRVFGAAGAGPRPVRRAARRRRRRAAATSTSPTRRTAASRSSTRTARSCARSARRARATASSTSRAASRSAPDGDGLRRRHLEPPRSCASAPDGQWRGASGRDPEQGLLRAARRSSSRRGSLYVADTGNKRIVRFDRDGQRSPDDWGGDRHRPGQFVEPVGLAADSVGPHLRRRHRQPPRPGLRRRRQVPAPVPGLRLEGLLHGALPRDRSGRQRHRDRLVEGPHRAATTPRARSRSRSRPKA